MRDFIDTLEGARTYVYARQSLDEQEQKNSAEYQILEGKAYYDANHERESMPPWSGALVDINETGSIPLQDRPQGQKLLAGLRKGDCLIVYKLDRLCRNFFDQFTVAGQFVNRGVRLFLLADDVAPGSIDLSSDAGRMILFMRAFTNERFLKDLSARTSSALKKLSAEGRKITTSPPPFCKFVLDPLGRKTNRGRPAMVIAPDEEVLGVWEVIQAWRRSGMTQQQCADRANAMGMRREGGRKWTAQRIAQRELMSRPSLKPGRRTRVKATS